VVKEGELIFYQRGVENGRFSNSPLHSLSREKREFPKREIQKSISLSPLFPKRGTDRLETGKGEI